MPKATRSERRFWTPRTSFERPVIEREKPVEPLLAGIPESTWDTPHLALDNLTPREAAQHVNTSGCRGCWDGIQNLKAVHE
ncbi:hypothetical protein [Mycolicibacterium conceptionense]|uniref:hypothetical protein n=1 Tax=Mycolicibacterium conceptionense TaxID=451644 RepID=UPI000A40474D|nr:hypothetical protein [Mycolicibacterium conceptionense]